MRRMAFNLFFVIVLKKYVDVRTNTLTGPQKEGGFWHSDPQSFCVTLIRINSAQGKLVRERHSDVSFLSCVHIHIFTNLILLNNRFYDYFKRLALSFVFHTMIILCLLIIHGCFFFLRRRVMFSSRYFYRYYYNFSKIVTFPVYKFYERCVRFQNR